MPEIPLAMPQTAAPPPSGAFAMSMALGGCKEAADGSPAQLAAPAPQSPARSVLLRDGASMLCEYVEGLWSGQAVDKAAKTVELASPQELEKVFREQGCALELEDGKAIQEASVLEACNLALRYSVKANHPRFFNQLFGRVEDAGLLGSWLASTVACNSHTYEVAPVFTLTEIHALRKLAAKVGYPSTADGLFVPGGSISNLYAMHLARYKAFPNVKEEGLWGCPPLVAFCSDHAHYSYNKAANVLGLGCRNLVKVASDRFGRMQTAALAAAIGEALAAGRRPFFVGATAGTTVMGAFDSIRELRALCDQHGLWLHVDAAWGGAALLSSSDAVRGLLDGVDSSDSIAWNPHKLMGLPLQCSAFITRHGGLLLECNRSDAAYLFQRDKLNADMDIGDKTIQCGRLPDSFKLWLAWKHLGDSGWAARVDKSIALAEHMAAKMVEPGRYRGRFRLVAPRSFANLCFWYFPPALEEFDPHAVEAGSAQWLRLHNVAQQIKSRMQARGQALIGFQSIPLGSSDPVPNFFRMVFASVWTVTEADVEGTLADIDAAGSDLSCTAE